MKKFLFLSVVMLILAYLPQNVLAGNTITVGNNKQFATIMDAYNAAQPNDTILIYPGEYFIPYNKEAKSFLTIAKDGITLKGVDKYGNDIKGSDFIEVTVSPQRYSGVVQAQALLYVKAHNIHIEGIHFISYIKDMPVTKWAGLGVSSGGSNRIITEQSKNYYTETTYEAIEDPSGYAPIVNKPIHDLIDVSELDKVNPRIKIIDLDEENTSPQTLHFKNSHQEINRFILSTIQLEKNQSYSDKVFSLETDYGIVEVPGNIINYIDNFYEVVDDEDNEHDSSIKGNYGDKLGIRFSLIKEDNVSLMNSISLKGNLAAPIVSFEAAVQTYAPVMTIYEFKNSIKKYVPLYDHVDQKSLSVYFLDTSRKITKADYKPVLINNKTFLEINNNLSGTVIAITSAGGFPDVPRDFWAYDAIQNLSEKGIVNGKGNRLFEPNDIVNRAEFITMLTGSISITTKKDTTMYQDVYPETWFFENVVSAESINILDNLVTNENEKFYPFAGLTREEMACILASYAKQQNIRSTGNKKINQFQDYQLIDPHYVGDVLYAVNAGIMKGMSDKVFDPRSTVTRAQAAYVIWNLTK